MGNTSNKDGGKDPSQRKIEDLIVEHQLEDKYFFKLSIPTPETWMELACQGSDRVFARTTMVKAVVQHFLPPNGAPGQPRHDPVLYFLNSQAYLTHLPFCANICHALSEFLDEPEHCYSHEFNLRNYKAFPRQFVLLSIVFYGDSQVFAVELWPGDNLPPQAILETHEMLRNACYFGDKLKWRAASPLHMGLLQQVPQPNFHPECILLDSDLFAGVSYQPLHMGVAFGICRIWRNGSRTEEVLREAGTNGADSQSIGVDSTGAPIVDKRTILVAEELPLDLNPVRGLVTAQLQTPLCHVALLCSNRGTPNMALKTALTDFAKYDGKLVQLLVNHGDFTLAEATEDQEVAWLAQKSLLQKRSCPPLKVDTSIPGPILLRDVQIPEDLLSTDPKLPLATAISNSIGSKALNLARFLQWGLKPCNNTGNNVSFIIPFYYFVHYVRGVAAEEIAMLSDPAVNEDSAKTLCSTIRERILGGSLPTEWQLLEAVEQHIEDWKKVVCFNQSRNEPFTADGVIFRSSTNCEDLPGFPSAGLYVSEPVTDPGKAQFEKAILKVWASVFLEKAYLERREFGITEKEVSMAILVMPLLRSCVKANGVAVTTNPFRVDLGGNYLNVQLGSVAVTDSCNGKTPEQVMFIRDGFRDLTIEYIASSNLLPPGEHIITTELATPLNRLLGSIGNGFRVFHTPESMTNAADVEFLILKNNEIVILQARPVKIQHRPR
jgi:hypothetical protein